MARLFHGSKDGIPIFLGYLSVSLAFGILAVKSGQPIWAPVLTSLTNFTGTGQFVGIDLIAANASLMEIAFTLLVINLRYMLMSLSLSQRVRPSMSLPTRLAMRCKLTVFAVAIQHIFLAALLAGSY